MRSLALVWILPAHLDYQWHYFVVTRSASETRLYLDGQTDEIRVWNTCLSQEQIRQSMNTLLTAEEPNLHYYFQLNETGTITQFFPGVGAEYGSVSIGIGVSRVASGAPVYQYPEVRTQGVANVLQHTARSGGVTQNSAQAGGEHISNGGFPVIHRGAWLCGGA